MRPSPLFGLLVALSFLWTAPLFSHQSQTRGGRPHLSPVDRSPTLTSVPHRKGGRPPYPLCKPHLFLTSVPSQKAVGPPSLTSVPQQRGIGPPLPLWTAPFLSHQSYTRGGVGPPLPPVSRSPSASLLLRAQARRGG